MGDLILGVGDIKVANYLFHIGDSWKDLLVTRDIHPNDKNLLNTCMAQLYGKDAVTRNYQNNLKQIEDTCIRETTSQKITVNRLKTINELLSVGTQKTPLYIPSVIKYGLYDGAGIGTINDFSEDIKPLITSAYYTDPATRSIIKGGSFFPKNNSRKIIIVPGVYEKLLPNSLYKFQTEAYIDSKNNCHIKVSMYLKQQGYLVFVINSVINSNIEEVSTKMGGRGEDSPVPFFTGNPTKNNWFLVNNGKNDPTSIYIGIMLLFCKEFMGDCAFALIGLLYNQVNSAGGAAAAVGGGGGGGAVLGASDALAVFTGDNALTAFCLMQQINVVSKSRLTKGKSFISDCIAYLFTDTNAMLENDKEREKARIIEHNTNTNNDLTTCIRLLNFPNTEIKGLGEFKGPNERKNIQKFLTYIIEIITHCNTLLKHIDTKNEETLEYFKKDILKYKVSNIVNKKTIEEQPSRKFYIIQFLNTAKTFPQEFRSVDTYDNELYSNKGFLIKLQNVKKKEAQSGGARTKKWLKQKLQLPSQAPAAKKPRTEEKPTTLSTLIVPRVSIELDYYGTKLYPNDIYAMLYEEYQNTGKIIYKPSYIFDKIYYFINDRDAPFIWEVELSNDFDENLFDWLDRHVPSELLYLVIYNIFKFYNERLIKEDNFIFNNIKNDLEIKEILRIVSLEQEDALNTDLDLTYITSIIEDKIFILNTQKLYTYIDCLADIHNDTIARASTKCGEQIVGPGLGGLLPRGTTLTLANLKPPPVDFNPAASGYDLFTPFAGTGGGGGKSKMSEHRRQRKRKSRKHKGGMRRARKTRKL